MGVGVCLCVFVGGGGCQSECMEVGGMGLYDKEISKSSHAQAIASRSTPAT